MGEPFVLGNNLEMGSLVKVTAAETEVKPTLPGMVDEEVKAIDEVLEWKVSLKSWGGFF